METNTGYIVVSELELGQWIAYRNDVKIIKWEMVKPKKIYKFHLHSMHEFVEEDVDFLSNPVKSVPSVYTGSWKDKESTKQYHSFGEKIYFRTGPIEYEKGTLPFIEGDMFANKSKNTYENEWRVRIFGSLKYLVELKNKENMVGTINRTTVTAGVSYYYVSGVEEVKKATVFCDYCNSSHVVGKDSTGFNICDDCSNYQTAQYGYC